MHLLSSSSFHSSLPHSPLPASPYSHSSTAHNVPEECYTLIYLSRFVPPQPTDGPCAHSLIFCSGMLRHHRVLCTPYPMLPSITFILLCRRRGRRRALPFSSPPSFHPFFQSLPPVPLDHQAPQPFVLRLQSHHPVLQRFGLVRQLLGLPLERLLALLLLHPKSGRRRRVAPPFVFFGGQSRCGCLDRRRRRRGCDRGEVPHGGGSGGAG